MEQKKTLLERASDTNINRPGKLGVSFGIVAGIGLGHTKTFSNTVIEVCPKKSDQELKDCWDLAAVGTVLVAAIALGLAEGSVGLYRRRKEKAKKDTAPGQVI